MIFQGVKWGIAGVFMIIGHIPYIGSGIFYVPGRPYNALENAIFFSFQRLIWAPIVGFIIVLHATVRFGKRFFLTFLYHFVLVTVRQATGNMAVS